MENRNAKLIVGASGGTAGSGAKTYKLALPSSWIREMGLGADARELDLCFDGDSITVRRHQSAEEFAAGQHAKGHDLRVFRYYSGSMLCTAIYADFTEKSIRADNYTADLVKTAFGKNSTPSWDDFLSFLEERCIPPERAGLREYLEALGLDEYDPLAIIMKTEGRMAEDRQWIEVSTWQ